MAAAHSASATAAKAFGADLMPFLPRRLFLSVTSVAWNLPALDPGRGKLHRQPAAPADSSNGIAKTKKPALRPAFSPGACHHAPAPRPQTTEACAAPPSCPRAAAHTAPAPRPKISDACGAPP